MAATFISLLTLLTVTLVSAESFVTSLFIPDVEGTALVASIISQSAGTTTYSINCPPGTDSSDCGVSPGLILTSGPKVVEWSMSVTGEFYGRMICSLEGTTTGTCTEIDSGSGANFPGTHTTTLDSTDITSLPVTVTAGAITAATTEASAPTAQSSDSVSQQSGSQTSGSSDTTTSRTSGSATRTMSSSTSTGGGMQTTGAPVLAMGGAAIAVVAVAL
ncbi:hypothetical protein N7450_003672 [Penicillium hetheringtonii]|uniref:GPI anchored protein n=1 Tax=Penicillium hetheringtonii TaxID=911720 RepID=A0AAD6DNJ7_9EURO|nr:hypothetical protein N7450_003672 [Penicillium hetheringtonii]